jgi:DNA-binding NarL/FixJ family response regulator
MAELLLVEDNAILAKTLVRFLQAQGELTVVAVAPSAEAAREQMRHLHVDLLLVDVSLPGMNGIDLVAMLHKQYPETPCLMLSGHSERDYVRRALDAGAKGYVIKSDPEAIFQAVNDVLAGEIFLSKELRRYPA